MTGHWSVEALFVGAVLSTLILIRSVLRAYSIPERELYPDTAEEAPTPHLPAETMTDPAASERPESMSTAS